MRCCDDLTETIAAGPSAAAQALFEAPVFALYDSFTIVTIINFKIRKARGLVKYKLDLKPIVSG